MHENDRLRELYNSGARYVARESDGEWGVAADTLDVLLLRLRGSVWTPRRIHLIERDAAPLVPSGQIVAAVERLEAKGWELFARAGAGET